MFSQQKAIKISTQMNFEIANLKTELVSEVSNCSNAQQQQIAAEVDSAHRLAELKNKMDAEMAELREQLESKSAVDNDR